MGLWDKIMHGGLTKEEDLRRIHNKSARLAYDYLIAGDEKRAEQEIRVMTLAAMKLKEMGKEV